MVARDPLGEFNIVQLFYLIRNGFCFTLWRYAIVLTSHRVGIKTLMTLLKLAGTPFLSYMYQGLSTVIKLVFVK